MTSPDLHCLDEQRRHAVREAGGNGLDYVEVADDHRTLTVFFIGPVPRGLTADNVVITGGQRIRDIVVVDVEICPPRDDDVDTCIVVTVDRPGDLSTYTLCLVDLPDDVRIDPRYRCLEFSFAAGCPTDVDCLAIEPCPPEVRAEPSIEYLAKDYASFVQLLFDRLAIVMPDWSERHVPDIGVTLVELFAYIGDHLSYQQDAVATEAYLGTARQRISVRRHGRLVDYMLQEGCNARTWVHIHTSGNRAFAASQLAFLTSVPDVPDHAGRVLTWDDLRRTHSDLYEVFEPLGDVTLRVAHNEIELYTWGDTECCLPRGATAATLVDEPTVEGVEAYDEIGRVLELAPGDLLIFEEMIGPRTGAAPDADPTHRHVVRLTDVTELVDPLDGRLLLDVTWREEDALPFPLCLSVVLPPPACEPLSRVSVARGNVVLADHGRTLDREDLGRVPVADVESRCEEPCEPAEVAEIAGPFAPVLQRGPLTFRQPVPATAAASTLLDQDPRRSLPALTVYSTLGDAADDATERQWTAQPDLLSSDGHDDHLVVEVDDRRRAHLRFGDGVLGSQPPPRAAFEAQYRIGNGPDGNVGADTLVLAVADELIDGLTLRPRNPLPARGGTAPETLAEARLYAPHEFRHTLERAVTADDYARLAEQHVGVQAAAAQLRWNGSWYEVRVAVDTLGRREPDSAMLDEITTDLHRYRRIGHDVAVQAAHYVALDIELDVCVAPGVLRGHVAAALRERFGSSTTADGTPGFFHPDELSFAGTVAVSRLLAAAQAVPGVDSAAVTRLERLFEGPDGELDQGVLVVGPLEVPRLDQDPNAPENGRITFRVRGGR